MGATRNVALNELPMRGISVNPATDGSDDITVIPSDSGILFVNLYLTATTYTLPTATDGKGKAFWFYNGQASNSIKVKALSNIIMGVDSTTGTVITSGGANISDSCVLFCDGTNYYAIILSGTWTSGSA